MNKIALRLAACLFDKPVIANQFRSAFVEAMLEPYLNRSGWRYVGADWGGHDFSHKSGTRLELKQSAAWQTWSGTGNEGKELQRKTGSGRFDIAVRKGWYNEAGNKYTKEIGRRAHVYVFAWNGYTEKNGVDHRDPDQWEFFILPSDALPNQKTLSLKRLRSIPGIIGPVVGPILCADALLSHESFAAPPNGE